MDDFKLDTLLENVYVAKALAGIGYFIIGYLIYKIVFGLLTTVVSKIKTDEILKQFILSIAKALMILCVIIAGLQGFGFDTNSLVALIGAAGLAIGLALQGSLQNFAAGFMLILFKPFKTGDFVEVAGTSGVVESIHIFSTTMKSPDNKEVIVPNGQIYGNTIINFTKRDTRRLDLVYGVSYGDDILKVKEILTSIVKADSRVLPEPAPVIALGELGDSSINFFVRPWVKKEVYWDVKFAINEQVKLQFDANDITIPFPQMDVHLDKLEK